MLDYDDTYIDPPTLWGIPIKIDPTASKEPEPVFMDKPVVGFGHTFREIKVPVGSDVDLSKLVYRFKAEGPHPGTTLFSYPLVVDTGRALVPVPARHTLDKGTEHTLMVDFDELLDNLDRSYVKYA
jgi:hypothetical protein